jgi:hypothetical protein
MHETAGFGASRGYLAHPTPKSSLSPDRHYRPERSGGANGIWQVAMTTRPYLERVRIRFGGLRSRVSSNYAPDGERALTTYFACEPAKLCQKPRGTFWHYMATFGKVFSAKSPWSARMLSGRKSLDFLGLCRSRSGTVGRSAVDGSGRIGARLRWKTRTASSIVTGFCRVFFRARQNSLPPLLFRRFNQPESR